MVSQGEPDLSLEQRIHQQPEDGAHRSRRNPFRFLKPHWGDGRRIFDPTTAWFSRGILLSIGLQNLGIRTPLSPYSRRQDEPPLLVLGPLQSRALNFQAIVDLFLRLLRLRRASPACPFFPLLAHFHPLAEGMIAPGPWPAASPPLAAAFIVGARGLRICRTGK